MQFATILSILTLTFVSFAIASPTPASGNRQKFGPGPNSQGWASGTGLNNGNGNEVKGINKGKITVQQAAESCGNAQLNCCVSLEQRGDQHSEKSSLLDLLFSKGDVGVGCAPMTGPLSNLGLDLISIAGAGGDTQSDIGDACKNQPVCCTGERFEQNGLVNLGCSPLDLHKLVQASL